MLPFLPKGPGQRNWWVRADSDIWTLQDFKGKVVGTPKGSLRVWAQTMLSAAGLTEEDYEWVSAEYAVGGKDLAERRIDVYLNGSDWPTCIFEGARTTKLRVLHHPPELLQKEMEQSYGGYDCFTSVPMDSYLFSHITDELGDRFVAPGPNLSDYPHHLWRGKTTTGRWSHRQGYQSVQKRTAG